ncbi:class I SAM-dependent methyltransferase [Hyunsoonleella flava]|uniref:Class I SAM-dependent methyltransferase n=1 Tax=Hyunsoonleella flava TaxID=2527939 RepID=A0A4Q9FFU2_9FLAO|nr:class I SAM-dependent methyltransferase [Hyunsoonleella flava]TBN04906.1 class I SAM-dependent methyltransferase [Hyunsoonleella flava]
MAAKYNTIGSNYNSTRKADPFLTKKLIELLRPSAEGTYLDIGCGTGNYTNALQQQGYQFIGIDPSELMLVKAKLLNDAIDWRIGTAEDTQLPDASVDGIIGSLTIHHWTDLKKALVELHRVLKPKGRIVIFTSTPEQMEGYWLNHYFPKMLQDSMAQMPSLERVKSAILNSGLVFKNTEAYFIQPDLKDQFLYCGKHEPELYFDPQVQHGISSFSHLSNKTEVERGLERLQEDVSSGAIKQIIDAYQNDKGDYLYVIAEKA